MNVQQIQETNHAADCPILNKELGIDHLAVLESMIVKKDSVQNRAMRGCAYEIKRSRDEIERLRYALEVMIAAFCPGDDWVGVYVRDQAYAALSLTSNTEITRLADRRVKSRKG